MKQLSLRSARVPAFLLLALSLTSCALVAPRETVTADAFASYFQMAQHIDHVTLPVGLNYMGKIGGRYVIAENTNRKNLLGALGGEEIATLKYITLPVNRVPRDAFPESPFGQRPGNDLSLEEIYSLWTRYKIPLPILSRATLDNWCTISKDSVLQPGNAAKYNASLVRTDQSTAGNPR